MKNPQYYELDLLKLLRALWRRMWAILLTAVLLAGAAYGVSAHVMTPMYEAEALMYVNNVSSPGSSSFSISSSELTAAQSLADTYIIILKARTTLTEVIQREELDYTYEELRDMVSSDTVNNTEVFNVRVTCEDPQEASRIANGIARVLPGKISDIGKYESAVPASLLKHCRNVACLAAVIISVPENQPLLIIYGHFKT